MKLKCPYCKKETVWENNPYRPFCSERCKILDLGNWIDGVYSVPCEDDNIDGKTLLNGDYVNKG